MIAPRPGATPTAAVWALVGVLLLAVVASAALLGQHTRCARLSGRPAAQLRNGCVTR